MTARKSLSFASASTQKTYRTFSCRSSRLTNGDRQVSASTCGPPASRHSAATRPRMPNIKQQRRKRRDMVASLGQVSLFGSPLDLQIHHAVVDVVSVKHSQPDHAGKDNMLWLTAVKNFRLTTAFHELARCLQRSALRRVARRQHAQPS